MVWFVVATGASGRLVVWLVVATGASGRAPDGWPWGGPPRRPEPPGPGPKDLRYVRARVRSDVWSWTLVVRGGRGG